MTSAVLATVPLTADAVKAKHTAIAETKEAWLEIRVTDADSDLLADEQLTEVVRLKDSLEATRGEATGPLYKVAKLIESWFRPALADLAEVEKHLKGERARYAAARAAAEIQARKAATAALQAGDDGALLTALAASTAAQPTTGVRGSAAVFWTPVAYDVNAMPREFLIPDTKKIAALAKAHKGEEAPAIPGVTFERTAQIGAKR